MGLKNIKCQTKLSKINVTGWVVLRKGKRQIICSHPVECFYKVVQVTFFFLTNCASNLVLITHHLFIVLDTLLVRGG